MKKKVTLFDIITGVVMVIISLTAIYPLYYIYINSVSGGAYVGANQVIFIPGDLLPMPIQSCFRMRQL